MSNQANRPFYCNPLLTTATLLLVIAICAPSFSFSAEILLPPQKNLTLKNEVARAKANATAYLKSHQNPDGSWSQAEFPALTGLVLHAFLTSSKFASPSDIPPFIRNGLNFLIANAKEDGSICKEVLPNYNTAVCLLALTAANDPQYYPIMIKARNYLISLQMDKGEKGTADYVFDGGIGYGSKYDHSDMSNTYFALESIKMSEFLESEMHMELYKGLKNMDKNKLNWEAALKFISRCQNLPGHNDQAWASDDAKNKGGFVYFPGDSKAGEETLADGKKALRSYGSMTYAGLLSLIYTDLKRDDPRVTSAYEWITKNYTLAENPGMGQEGLFYYYHTMAKALSAMKVDLLTTPDGKSVDWRNDLLSKLVAMQKGEGFWVNDSGRWWENDPILVTAYALITINLIGS